MTETLPPLAQSYLADLDRALASAEPRERAETLAAVREHLTESLRLQEASDDDAVARVLAELGPVDEIAAATTPASPAAIAALPAMTAPPRREDGGLLALSIVGLVLFWLPPLALASLIWAITRLRSHDGDRGRQWAALWISAAALVVFAVAFAGLASFSTLDPVVTEHVEVGAPVP